MTEVPTVEAKQCSKCHEEKPASEFDRYKRTADGLQSQCKSCMKVQQQPNLAMARSPIDILHLPWSLLSY